jgi:hypothetical protein
MGLYSRLAAPGWEQQHSERVPPWVKHPELLIVELIISDVQTK